MRPLPAGSQVFMIELVARPGVDGIRALRALLKIARRTFELRCIEAREIRADRASSAARDISPRSVLCDRADDPTQPACTRDPVQGFYRKA